MSVDLREPPPRPVRLGPRTTTLLAVATLFGLSIVFGGLLALVAAGHMLYLSSHSRPVDGRVIQVVESRYNGPGGQTAPGQVVFEALSTDLPPRAPHTGSITLSSPPYLPDGQSPPHSRYRVGEIIELRLVHDHARLMLIPWDRSPAASLLSLVAFGMLLIGLSLVALIRLWRVNIDHWHLLSRGQAVNGEIVAKRMDAAGGPCYYIRYAFSRGSSFPTEEHEERCTGEQWRRLGVEHPVTVLIDPERPEHPYLRELIHVHE